jgi:hypothetical protein
MRWCSTKSSACKCVCVVGWILDRPAGKADQSDLFTHVPYQSRPSHGGGPVKQFVDAFLQIRSSQFHIFILALALLGLAYRAVAMVVLIARIRYVGKDY